MSVRWQRTVLWAATGQHEGPSPWDSPALKIPKSKVTSGNTRAIPLTVAMREAGSKDLSPYSQPLPTPGPPSPLGLTLRGQLTSRFPGGRRRKLSSGGEESSLCRSSNLYRRFQESSRRHRSVRLRRCNIK